jgi:hypothetical protein
LAAVFAVATGVDLMGTAANAFDRWFVLGAALFLCGFLFVQAYFRLADLTKSKESSDNN